MTNINYQTIDGQPLTRDEFKEYFKEVIEFKADNKDFKYPEFMYELRNKCGMTLEQFTDIIAEINMETLIPDEARIMNPFKKDEWTEKDIINAGLAFQKWKSEQGDKENE